MLGVNQTIMMALGIVVIAATVGYPGLGLSVYEALQTLDVGAALTAGLGIVILAIVLDRVSARVEPSRPRAVAARPRCGSWVSRCSRRDRWS